MSTPPGVPPYGPPPQTRSAPEGKPPPSWLWFLGPLVLLVLAGAIFSVMLLRTVDEVTQVDARVPVDGAPHRVTVPADGERMLFADASAGAAPCRVTDSRGREIAQRDVLGDLSMTRDGQDWSGLTRFDPGDGTIVVTCPRAPGAPATEVLVTPAHDVSSVVIRVVVTIVVPMILGGIALLWALIIGILMLTRRSTPS